MWENWFSWENLKEKDHLKDLGADWKIVLKWKFKKWERKVMD